MHAYYRARVCSVYCWRCALSNLSIQYFQPYLLPCECVCSLFLNRADPFAYSVQGAYACVEGDDSEGLSVIVRGSCHLIGNATASAAEPASSASSSALSSSSSSSSSSSTALTLVSKKHEVVLSTLGEGEWFGDFSVAAHQHSKHHHHSHHHHHHQSDHHHKSHHHQHHSHHAHIAGKPSNRALTSVRVASDYCLMLRLDPQNFQAFAQLLPPDMRRSFDAMSAQVCRTGQCPRGSVGLSGGFQNEMTDGSQFKAPI